MKERIFKLAFITLLAITAVVFFAREKPQEYDNAYLNEPYVRLASGTIIHTEIADTPQERELGLSNRDSLGVFEGLLFLHDNIEVPAYWMKDMRFPIDIIWIRGNVVVGTEESLLPEEPPKSMYSPRTAIDKVLEVNAGFVNAQKIHIGDELDISLTQE